MKQEFSLDSKIFIGICYKTWTILRDSSHKKTNRKKPRFNWYSKPWKEQDLTKKNQEKERKTWYMLLMRFNQVLVRFHQILVGFNRENVSVWQNYWQTKKSRDKWTLSMLKHWQTKFIPRLTNNNWCKPG